MTGSKRGALHWLASLARNLFRGQRADADLADDVGSYVDLLTDEKIAQGMTPDEARRAALLEFGGVESAKEQARSVRAGALLEEVWRDVRYGLRTARRNPGFTIAAVLTLALGIGASTAVFTVVNAVLLRDLPYGEPDRVVRFQNHDTDSTFGVSERERLIYAAESLSFADFATYYFASANLSGGGEAERLFAAVVDPNVFDALRVRPARGRLFEAADAAGGPGTVVVFTDDFWTRRYGRDEAVIGQTVTLNDRPRTIIGVLPPAVALPGAFSGRGVDVYLPQVFVGPPDPENIHYLDAVARLAPGISLELAREAIAARAVEVGNEIGTLPPAYSVRLIPVDEVVLGDVRPGLVAVSVAVGLLLLIACGNLASLLLARARQRTAELSLRAALGAGRGRLVRQMLTESVLLAVVGGVLGVAVAFGGTQFLLILGPNVPRLGDVAVDGTALAFTFGLSILTGLFFGLLPAWVQSRTGLQTLAAGTGRGAGGSVHFRGRRPLVAVQVALAVALAIGAGLLGRSIGALSAVPPGFEPEGVLTMRVTLPSQRYPDLASTQRYYQETLADLRALPGVVAAGASTHLPLVNGTGDWGLMIEGFPERLDNGRRPDADWSVVSEGYFEAMGIRVVEGRAYEPIDTLGSMPVTVINERTAREYWPNESALGGRIQMTTSRDPVYRQVVGVVADVRHDGLDQVAARQMFLPMSQFPTGRDDPFGSAALVVRTTGDPLALVGSVRAALARRDPNVPVALIRTMEDIVADSTSVPQLYLLLFAVFSGLAITIVSVGVYGVASYLVATRRRELAIRRALGATSVSVVLLVLREGTTLALTGVAAGVLGALAFGGVLESLLYDVSGHDLMTFVTVPLAVTVVTVMANLLPARAALRESAVHALRLE